MRQRLAILIVLALVGVACSSTTEPTGTQAPDEASPSTPAPGTDRSPEPDGGPDEQPQPGGGGMVQQPPGGPGLGGGGNDGPTAVRPPRPGTYTYNQTGSTTAGAFTFDDDPTGTLVIAAATESSGFLAQRQIRTYSDNAETEQLLRFNADGTITLAQLVSRFFTSELTCTLKPRPLVLDADPQEGDRWSGSGKCDGRTLNISGTAFAPETLTIGGTAVETVKVRLRLRFSGDGIDQVTTTTAWLSPEHRLIVKSKSHSEGTADGAEFTQDRSDELVSLTPA